MLPFEKKYMKYNNFCFLTKKCLFFCVYYNNELYNKPCMNKVENSNAPIN